MSVAPESIHDFDSEGDVTRYEAEERDRFIIENDEQAAWAMRKLLSYSMKADENAAIADAEHQRIDAWLTRQNAKFESDILYFRGLLIHYAERQRLLEQRKSVETPYGAVKSRQGQPKWVIDEAEFLPWAKDNHPEFVRVKEEADLAAMKKSLEVADTDSFGPVAIDDAGQIIPGVSIAAATVNYTIEVSK